MNYLTPDQLKTGRDSLLQNKTKLSLSQVGDLVSVFRGFLGDLAPNYQLQETFEGEIDNYIPETNENGSNRCAKLAACLYLLQDNELGTNGGFAATNANKTGFNYSIDQSNYLIFKYMMGLFWVVPDALESRFLGRRSGGIKQGRFQESVLRQSPNYRNGNQ